MMRTENCEVDITAEDIQLLVQVGISKAYIHKALPEHLEGLADTLLGTLRPTGRGLSDTEIAVLRRGGARGLDDSTDDRRCLRESLDALIKECRAFVTEARDTTDAASLLGLSKESIVSKTREVPPSLAVLELDEGTLKFPRWQFTESGAIPHLSDLLSLAYPQVKPFFLARFIDTPHVDLDVGTGRLSPRAWLVRGLDPGPVLDAVKSMTED
tara:strand:- start:1407 stop:2045 length:639 start_codon:yes stop_codon:yes gene_type:complete